MIIDPAAHVYNVLILCTGNSARSILAESILNHDGAGRFRAWSAGSDPKGTVHPMAIDVLTEAGVSVDGVRSKSWDEFAKPDAPAFDFIFTVCDNAAGETCPIWPGHPVTVHWGIEDPAAVEGDGQRAAFKTAFRLLQNRVVMLLSLPIESLDPATLKSKLQEIGRTEGATDKAGSIS